ncbi:MAG: type II secretion system F family protein [Armatimonadetes bacterium]|nr:type II secretion system F family protein [Armatimonadota bacterium]
MSIELMVVIGLWIFALTLAGLSILQEIRARQLRERVSRMVRTRILEEEGQILAEIEEEELKSPLTVRLFRTFVLPVIQKFSRFVPQASASLKVTEELLAMAGYPLGLTSTDLMGLRLLLTLSGAFLGAFLPIVAAFKIPGIVTPLNIAISVSILSIMGFLGPIFWLRRVANQRRRRIMRQLPDMLDLITLSIEAGLAFDGAVYEATRRFKGPLSDELRKAMREVTLGKSRSQALRDMAERLKLEDVSLLVSAVHQSETLGSPLADALKALAGELRKKRLRIIREQIAKLPVKLIFPLVLFIFPTLFIVILGPAVIQLSRMGLGGG